MGTGTTYRRRETAVNGTRSVYGSQSRPGYVNGSAAPQLQPLPERRREVAPKKEIRQRPVQRPVSMPSISGTSFVFLILAIGVTVGTCFSYLQTQSHLTQMKSEIVSLQSENDNTTIENKEKKESIANSVDLSYVYDIATGKLGMVQAKKNQIYEYNNKKSDMVKQYADIPAANK